jgi:hypothetical protein
MVDRQDEISIVGPSVCVPSNLAYDTAHDAVPVCRRLASFVCSEASGRNGNPMKPCILRIIVHYCACQGACSELAAASRYELQADICQTRHVIVLHRELVVEW